MASKDLPEVDVIEKRKDLVFAARSVKERTANSFHFDFFDLKKEKKTTHWDEVLK